MNHGILKHIHSTLTTSAFDDWTAWDLAHVIPAPDGWNKDKLRRNISSMLSEQVKLGKLTRIKRGVYRKL